MMLDITQSKILSSYIEISHKRERSFEVQSMCLISFLHEICISVFQIPIQINARVKLKVKISVYI